MMLDVKVTIDLTKPVGKLGFGFPLVLSVGEAKEYKECSSLAEVTDAGFAESTDTYKAVALMFSQNNPPSKVAVCGIAEATELSSLLKYSWRQIVVAGEANESIETAIAATKDKMMFTTTSTKSSSDRVVGFGDDYTYSAALVGEAAGREVGSFTYKNLILNGIEPVEISDTELEALHTGKKFTFVTKAGDNVTSEGITTSGEYIDIIDAKDYVIQQITYGVQKTLNNSGKIPYDDKGIALLESSVVNVMRDAFTKGIIASNEDGTAAYTVNFAKREDTEATDRATRKYLGGQFSFTLAGAIHTVEVTGEIII